MKQGLTIWITTDTHFGHRRMEEYCGRPKDFETRIYHEFSRLTQNDILIHLGDICIGNDEKWHSMFIQTLSCRKILVRGNHDKKSNNWYMSHGWDFVCDTFSGTFFQRKILFSHMPSPDNGMFDVNVHGHLHNRLSYIKARCPITTSNGERDKDVLNVLTPKHKLISLENNNYKLTHIQSLI